MMAVDYGIVLNTLACVRDEYSKLNKMRQWRADPALWAKERMGIDLWSLQREISESVRDNKKTIVKSCHDSGKTFLAAVLVCWWIDTHPSEQTRVITTAPTVNQVQKIMWEYIRKLHRAHGLSGSVDEAAQWKSDNRDVVGYGRKPADTNVHAFQGVHYKYVLVIIDEACGVPESIWTGVEAITTNPDNRILAIGNPDDPATEFGRIFRMKDPSWERFTISAFSTPNFTEERLSLPLGMSEMLLDPKWVDEKALSWGKDSARYIAKVNAEFPTETINTFFSPTLLDNAVDTTILPKAEDRGWLGVDVARFGNDKTVCVYNLGGLIEIADSWSKEDIVSSANRVHSLALNLGVSEVRVDGSGLGIGVVDNLTRLCGSFYTVVAIVGSDASPDKGRWINLRAFLHDHCREMMALGQLSLPEVSGKETPAAELYEDLEGLTYKFKKGAIQIESKDDMRARGLKSPDYSDALMYAVAPSIVDDPRAIANGMGDDAVYNPEVDDEYLARGYICAPY